MKKLLILMALLAAPSLRAESRAMELPPTLVVRMQQNGPVMVFHSHMAIPAGVRIDTSRIAWQPVTHSLPPRAHEEGAQWGAWWFYWNYAYPTYGYPYSYPYSYPYNYPGYYYYYGGAPYNFYYHPYYGYFSYPYYYRYYRRW